MAEVTYAIVFSGEIVEGFQAITVKAHLAKMLKATPDKMKVLFSGKPIVLKRTQDKAEAAKYGGALKKVGANVRVKIIKSDAAGQTASAKTAGASPRTAGASPRTAGASPNNATAAPKVSAPAKPVTAPAAPNDPPIAARTTAPDISGLSLAPNEGNIVEPSPEPPAPDLDLSGISVAENDGSPLVEPEPEVQVDIDVSNISVAENDGSPLVEPSSEPAPIVNAPDFGLDEPGAVLETLKEEVEELNPDTSGMSLAFPGSDLLNPEEKDQGPPPEAPDTSKLSVVPVRAVFE